MRLNTDKFTGSCACGRSHGVSTREIIIERGALSHIPRFVRALGALRPAVVCDENTLDCAGRPILESLGPNALLTVLGADGHADNAAVDQIMLSDADLYIAAGSGTVHDAVRFSASRRSVPFISAPTAASVDGFASSVAAMTWNGFKQTFPAAAPVYIAADTGVFARAPYRLTASGISDLMGKHIALADWKIASLVTGEHFCERIRALELDALCKVQSSLGRIRNGEDKALERLMLGLVLSGIAMQMEGSSRPASGAEHHLSHLWEMELLNPPLDALHGEKVSVGALCCAFHYAGIKRAINAGKCAAAPYVGLERDLISKYAAQRYEQIIEENTPDPLLCVDISRLLDALPGLARILDEIPGESELAAWLKAAGCAASFEDIGLDRGVMELSLKLAPYVRSRVTFLRLAKLLRIV